MTKMDEKKIDNVEAYLTERVRKERTDAKDHILRAQKVKEPVKE